ncbi:MAG: sugar transporter, partial [Mycobacterium sp.]|nr:sugar transporter [Mycobacterium sp.]
MSEHGTFSEPAPEWTADDGAGGSTASAVLLASVAAIGGFLFGYDTAVINGAVAAIRDTYGASSLALGLTVSSALVGSAIGALSAGRLADRYGRLLAMRVAAVLFLASAVGSGLAWSLGSLAVFRVVGGIAVGIASVIAPAYIAEIAPARMRGRLGSLQQLAIVSGIFLALLVDYAIAAAAGGTKEDLALGLAAWRWMFLVMAVPAVVYGLLSLSIPESPRHLVAKGRYDEARTVLRRLLGEGGLDRKVALIRETLKRETVPSMRDLRGPALGLLPIVWVGIGLSVFQQFVGINVIFYYSSVLWQAVGFSEQNSLLITVITSVVNIVSTVIAIVLVDRIGRRPLLLIGSAGMAVTLGALAYVFANAALDAKGNPVL